MADERSLYREVLYWREARRKTCDSPGGASFIVSGHVTGF